MSRIEFVNQLQEIVDDIQNDEISTAEASLRLEFLVGALPSAFDGEVPK